MTMTEQVSAALLAKGFRRLDTHGIAVYLRQCDSTVVGLETFADGGCLLWGLLSCSEEAKAMVAAIPSRPQGHCPPNIPGHVVA